MWGSELTHEEVFVLRGSLPFALIDENTAKTSATIPYREGNPLGSLSIVRALRGVAPPIGWRIRRIFTVCIDVHVFVVMGP